MTPDLSPADEYEQERDRRGWHAIETVKAGTAWWAVFHLIGLMWFCCGAASNGIRPSQLIGVGIVWVVLMIPAGCSVATVLRHRSVLPIGWVAVGLAPWAVMLAELTLVAVVLLAS